MRRDVTRFAPDSDARWRAEYRQAQYERALVGIQPDLFGAPVLEVFRPLPIVGRRRLRYLDLIGAKRSEKVALLELRDVEPVKAG